MAKHDSVEISTTAFGNIVVTTSNADAWPAITITPEQAAEVVKELNAAIARLSTAREPHPLFEHERAKAALDLCKRDRADLVAKLDQAIADLKRAKAESATLLTLVAAHVPFAAMQGWIQERIFEHYRSKREAAEQAGCPRCGERIEKRGEACPYCNWPGRAPTGVEGE